MAHAASDDEPMQQQHQPEGRAAPSPLAQKRRVVSVMSPATAMTPATSTTPGSAESDRLRKHPLQPAGLASPPPTPPRLLEPPRSPPSSGGGAAADSDDVGGFEAGAMPPVPERDGIGLQRTVSTVSRSSSNGGGLCRRPSFKWSEIRELHRQSSDQSVPDFRLPPDGADGDDLEAPAMPRLRPWSSNCSSEGLPRSWGAVAVPGRATLQRTRSIMGPEDDDFAVRGITPIELFRGVGPDCGMAGGLDSPRTPGAVTPGMRTPAAAASTARRRLMSPPTPGRRGLQRTLSSLARDPDSNDGRFVREFTEVQQIGEGSFSMVFKARNKVDNCWFAIKRTKEITQGGREKIQEAVVLAALTLEDESSSHVVRYFSSWFESGQLFIQMELCQGSLRDEMQRIGEEREEDDPRFEEAEIVEVVGHVAGGLRAMHAHGFVHLDIKPDNILRGRGAGGAWKIGDLGLAVAAIDSECDDVSEGDCRYLAREVLQGRLGNLASADVFSLGAMVVELAQNPEPLPCGGDDWHALRDGFVDFSKMRPYGEHLRDLVGHMVAPDPEARPSCVEILRHPGVRPDARPSAEEQVRMLQEELEQQRRQSELNAQKAQEYEALLASMRKQQCDDEVAAVVHRPRRSGPCLGGGGKIEELLRVRQCCRHNTM